jgi:hypothetical protein
MTEAARKRAYGLIKPGLPTGGWCAEEGADKRLLLVSASDDEGSEPSRRADNTTRSRRPPCR